MPNQSERTVPEEFAGNEWLVEELFEKFETDRNSVDEKWWPLFDQWAGTGASSETDQKSAPIEQTPDTVSPGPETVAKVEKSGSAVLPAAQESKPATKQPVAKSTTAPSKETSQRPAKAPEAPEEDKVVTLRGPAKAVATNMDESLSVPTATTVRAIPAKLLIDNRTEINSYLT
ncbi:hypothetical protein P3386_24430, partial [Vibrio parahaemolyticus]|nr:hypothetical protein [Vibrio parahaemolyticus]